jgi:ribonuclease P/MRP protein subunit POP1
MVACRTTILTLCSRLTSGSRTHETHIYEPGKYPFGLICPISIIWKPVSECVKGKESGSSTPTSAPGSSLERTVWIRFHPTVHSQVISALQTAGSQYLAKKKAEGNEGVQLEICDLKDQINVFEIMGPQASQVIRGALSAVPGDSRPEFRQVRLHMHRQAHFY